MLALDFRTFLENIKMLSLLLKILETGINLFIINSQTIKILDKKTLIFRPKREQNNNKNPKNQDGLEPLKNQDRKMKKGTNLIYSAHFSGRRLY